MQSGKKGENRNRDSREQKEDRVQTKNTEDKRMGNKEERGNHANGKREDKKKAASENRENES